MSVCPMCPECPNGASVVQINGLVKQRHPAHLKVTLEHNKGILFQEKSLRKHVAIARSPLKNKREIKEQLASMSQRNRILNQENLSK